MFPVGKQILEGVLVRDITAKANVDKWSGLMRDPSAFHGEDETGEDGEDSPDT